MFDDICIIVNKELIELKASGKRIFLLLLPFIPIIMFIKTQGSKSMLPVELSVFIIPIFIAAITAEQLVFSTILNEKKENTLELLLASGVSRVSIIIGKVIPGCLISYLISIIFIIIMKVSIVLMHGEIIYNLSFNTLILPFFTAYFVACLSIAMTIIIHDEKVTPTLILIVSIGIILGIAYILNRFNIELDASALLISLGINILLSLAITFFTSKLLKNTSLLLKL